MADFDIHHCLPSSRGGSNERENLRKVKVKRHRNYHSFFINDTVNEAIVRILDWNGEALREEFRLEILSIVSDEDVSRYYKKEAIKQKVSTP